MPAAPPTVVINSSKSKQFSELGNTISSPHLTPESTCPQSSCSKSVLGVIEVDLTIGGLNIFEPAGEQQREEAYCTTKESNTIQQFRKRSGTTLVVFHVENQWRIGTDSKLTEERLAQDSPLSSSDSDPEDPTAVKHVQLFGGIVLALFSGIVSHARKSIKILKNLVEEGDNEPPTVTVLAEMLVSKLKERNIKNRYCDIVLVDSRRRDVDGIGISHVQVEYAEIKIFFPPIDKPIAFGSGEDYARAFIKERLPRNIWEATLLIRGAIEAAYLDDEHTGEDLVLICGSEKKGWTHERLAKLGEKPVSQSRRRHIEYRQKKIREKLGMTIE